MVTVEISASFCPKSLRMNSFEADTHAIAETEANDTVRWLCGSEGSMVACILKAKSFRRFTQI